MKRKQIKTLRAIFVRPADITPEWARNESRIYIERANTVRPTTATIFEWAHIESLLIGAGCTQIEANGSRVRFMHRGTIASFHRPHPTKEAKAYQADDVRAFLISIGVMP